MDHVRLYPTRLEPARQPEAVTTGFEGNRNPREKWRDGPQTFLGILVDGFPNMLMVMGPHAGLGNIPRAAEYCADWVTELVCVARERGLTQIESTAEDSIGRTAHVLDDIEG